MEYRIGASKDIHVLVPDRKLLLAGVHVPYHLGEKAHSDGDVVYHALSEAILGALALGDLGKHFPDNDPSTEGMDSSIILKFCANKVKEFGYKISNIDVSIELEQPKLLAYVEIMKTNIAQVCNIDINKINIKCMTNEHMDSVGKGEAVVCYSVVLIEEK